MNGNNLFVDAIHRFRDGHERLKHSVHSYWRQNTYLSPRGTMGKVVMSGIYFSIPVIAGYWIATRAVAISEATVHERLVDRSSSGDGGPETLALGGDKILVGDRVEKVGAGGWGGGVHLVTSDSETQKVNRVNLERFLKKQRKLKEKREQEATAESS